MTGKYENVAREYDSNKAPSDEKSLVMTKLTSNIHVFERRRLKDYNIGKVQELVTEIRKLK